MQCEMGIGLEERNTILEETWNERQIQRNSEGHRDKNRSRNMLFRNPLVNSQDKVQ